MGRGDVLELHYRRINEALGSSQDSVQANTAVTPHSSAKQSNLHRQVKQHTVHSVLFSQQEAFPYSTERPGAQQRHCEVKHLLQQQGQNEQRVLFSLSCKFRVSAPPSHSGPALASLPSVSKMEPLTTTYPLKYSVPKARVFVVFLSMVLCTAVLCILQLRFFKPKSKDFYSFEVKDSRGRIVSLEKYRGKVSYNFILSFS